MRTDIFKTSCAAGAIALAAFVSVPATAQSAPELAERTAQSDLPLEGPRAAMQIEHVRLAIAVDPEARRIDGTGEYRIAVSQDLSQLQFDFDPRYEVSGVTVNGRDVAPSAVSNPDGLMTIDLPRSLDGGDTVDVGIAYSGSPHVARNAPWSGGIVWDEFEGQPWIATAFQGEGCDLLWPCIDNSAHRVGEIETLWTVPAGLVATGNGALVSETDNGDGTTTFHWRARDPSNYGVVLQIGPYELAESTYDSRYGNTVPIKFWHLPGNEEGANRLVGEMADYLQFFEEVIGPYPFADEKAGIVETPHLGMEHQTINAYGNRFRRDPLGYDWLLHHEFAHEWFANQLTHQDKRHMWLHEGIGTWMQPLYLGWARGQMTYDAEMWRQRQGILSRVPLVPPEGELPDYNDSEAGWGGDIYAKGAWIMHTLRHVVGDDVLFPALRELTYGTDAPAPGDFSPVSRTTEDFRRILEERGSGDLEWFFDAYFYQADLPRLVTERSGNTLSFRWQTASAMPFEMPLDVRMGNETVRVPMSGGRGTLALPGEHTSFLADPDNRILKYDEAIAHWQEERLRGRF